MLSSGNYTIQPVINYYLSCTQGTAVSSINVTSLNNGNLVGKNSLKKIPYTATTRKSNWNWLS